MKSVIVVHPDFDAIWPFAADHFRTLWTESGELQFMRLEYEDRRSLGEIIVGSGVERAVALNVPVTPACVQAFPDLREIAVEGMKLDEETERRLQEQGVKRYKHSTEGFWGQSVSEFALALTLCGLRRIPQTYREMMTSLEPWIYDRQDGIGRAGERGQQFGDDTRFTNGTVEGKRVRIVGAGNIASRYASFVRMLGADVAAWDPYASEPAFHRAGARKEYHLERLVRDAEIFAPMVPLTASTEGLVTGDLIRALPRGCLVVLATRANICEMAALRERVLNDELSLAADVFDIEPMPFDDPLLGRHNVVHTPHNAGRTIDANRRYAEKLAEQFVPED